MNELRVKQLVEDLSQHSFNLNNWTRIAERVISDDVVIGGIKKVTGKQIKDSLDNSLSAIGEILTELSVVVGNTIEIN